MMRYSRMPSEKKKTRNIPAIIAGVLVLCAVGVYLIGAHVISDFFSQNVVAPVAALFTAQVTAEPSVTLLPQASETPQSTQEESKTITIEKDSVYAIQMGVFDEQANADALAVDAKAKGGAGYIIEDAGKRVILAGYPTKDEAQTVKDNLETSQEMETAVYEIVSPELEFVVQGNSEEIASFESAVQTYSTAQDSLYDLIIAFDKAEKNEEQTVSELEVIATSVENAKKTVDGITKAEDNSGMDLVGMFELVENSLRTLSNSTGIELSSGLKYAYIGFAVQRQEMIKQVQQSSLGS